jgi:glutathione S-transferase
MLALYHFGGSIAAQKVRIALAEKRLDYESRGDIGSLRDPEYLRLNPNGVVPTLIHDGRVLVESRIISEYLEDTFPTPALMPRDPYERYRARYWSKQVDDSLHLNIFTVSFVAYMRAPFLAMPEQSRMLALPGLNDPVKRQRALDLLERGHESIHVVDALRRFRVLIDEMEASLSSAPPWLAGQQYSLADVDLTPILHRLQTLGLDPLWAERPAVRGWFARVRERESYTTGILDWITPEEDASAEGSWVESLPSIQHALVAGWK